jgi:predicted AlkP superfamily pyrophosphatase or phosphodiesterase
VSLLHENVLFSGCFRNKSEDYRVVADHGYDYIDQNMHAIFFARGPNIRPQTLVEPFQNIELFNLFTGLLFLLITSNLYNECV